MTATSGFFIQSRFGLKGNFEVVVPRFHAQLLLLNRNNDKANLPWSQAATFGSGDFTGASLVQSNFGSGLGNFEVVAIQGNQMLHFWRADSLPFAWSGPTPIGGGVTGSPSLIQGRFGTRGNFELVAPLVTGGLGHWWRDNDTAGLPWHGPTEFGQTTGQVQGASLIQSSYGTPGNLEVVAVLGSGSAASLAHFWRDNTDWHGPTAIPLPSATASPPVGQPGFVEAANGDFYVIASRGHRFTEMRRDNNASSPAWGDPVDFPTFPTPSNYFQVSVIQSNYGPPGLGNLEVVARSSGAGPGVLQAHHFWRAFAPGSSWSNPNQLPT
jgi:hypothetical protein